MGLHGLLLFITIRIYSGHLTKTLGLREESVADVTARAGVPGPSVKPAFDFFFFSIWMFLWCSRTGYLSNLPSLVLVYLKLYCLADSSVPKINEISAGCEIKLKS